MAENVVERIAEYACIDDRSAVGIHLKPAAVIVRQYGEQSPSTWPEMLAVSVANFGFDKPRSMREMNHALIAGSL